MKTSDIKTLKGKVDGVSSTLVMVSEVDKSLGNILFVLGFKQTKEYYYKAGNIDIVAEAKTYIKRGKYNGTEQGEVDFVNQSYSSIDKIDEVDELNRLLNFASVNT